MAHVPLRDLTNWELADSEQDIRGSRVVDGTGNTIGEVDQLIVDTESHRVEEIVLRDGQRYSTADIDIVDGVVRLNAPSETRVR